ncbi:hypothetical protein RO3G_16133 [Rhizopus delemar RA 99-880]|uniref:Integrase catalytic domain-containing protein n=1 Tax=Rhizopus delemar (strain RA 99-880 / ATCC MYA-4621 / FGSC 9543 / NRRL 43880) TaxID=246409 RepID=I1CSJ2_RHIO9|nr:hypothetical protein RO3G_16133 [Rhizopus delemar RA 99-880]|eukprot:EIE91422.1 hypothetical protein RO3G_16133 [Rhizopus delemar RA 99-880]
MEQYKIDQLTQYLQTMKIAEDATSRMKKYLKKEANRFTIYRDILYRYNTDNGIIRKVLNKKEAEEIMYAYHQHPLGGHLAYNNTLHKISSRYYWDNMSHDIMEYVKKCYRCQMHGKKMLKEELYPVAVSAKPFDRVALDVKHVQTSRSGHRYIIAAIDYLTKYVEARPLRFQNASEIALFVYEDIICRHGCPTIMVSDNVYGYEPRTPFDLDHHLYEKNSPKFEAKLWHRTTHQIHNLNRIREQATQAIKQTQIAQKKAIEKKLLDQSKELKPPFKIGELVLVFKDYMSTSWSGKLQDKWEGPFIIQHILGKGTYHIKSADIRDTKLRRVHGNRLKAYLLPKTQWIMENERILVHQMDTETQELLH